MPLPRRLHILGASGSGTTSLATAIAARHGHRHLDTDDFFWMQTTPPYQDKRPREERRARLAEALRASSAWVLSGSLCGWGDPFIPEFELVVFVTVPTAVRLARLRLRERARYGEDAIAPGGDRHQASEEFLEWAARYDSGGVDIRSRALHEAWLATLPCPVIRLDGEAPVADQLARIERRALP